MARSKKQQQGHEQVVSQASAHECGDETPEAVAVAVAEAQGLTDRSAPDSAGGGVTVRVRPAEEAPTYQEWKAEQERLAEERRCSYAKMKEQAASEVETLLQRFHEHRFYPDQLTLEAFYRQSVVPLSAEMLLHALIEEGRVERTEMQARQMVIQRLILNSEFQRRCTESPKIDAPKIDAPKRAGLSLVKPGGGAAQAAGGIVLPFAPRHRAN